jgi:hypothetical protein
MALRHGDADDLKQWHRHSCLCASANGITAMLVISPAR